MKRFSDNDDVDPQQLQDAVSRLSDRLVAVATGLASRAGFGDIPVTELPTALRDAYANAGGRRVANARGSIPAAFGCLDADSALWVVRLFAQIKRTEGPLSELGEAITVLEMLREGGVELGSLEWRILHSSIVEVLIAEAELGRTITDAQRFVLESLRHGLRAAIRAEGRLAQSAWRSTNSKRCERHRSNSSRGVDE